MAHTLTNALARVKGVVALEDAIGAVRRQSRVRFTANTHVHIPPNFSAFADVPDAVRRAAAERLACLGAGNYYDFTAYAGFAAQCLDEGILPLFGVEVISLDEDLRRRGVKVNDPDNPGRTYVCGKGISRFDSPSAPASDVLRRIREGDRTRMRAMLGLLNGCFARAGIPVGLDERKIAVGIAARCGAPEDTVTIQERHLALAGQEALFDAVPAAGRESALARLTGAKPSAPSDPVRVQQELRSRLMKAGGPCYAAEEFVLFAQARGLVLDLGGIPCYPVLADGALPVCGFEADIDALADAVMSRGIHCVEFIPARNDASVLERYVKALRGAGLVVTAGTEHNTPQMLALVPRPRGGAALSSAVEEIFMEGAAVVAAHQHLCLSGGCGFVDAEGKLNPAFGNREAVIESMAAIGRFVIGSASRFVER